MANKTWIVNFKLPQLSASHYWQSTTVEAANVGLAINRAWADIKKRSAVKGKRVSQATVTVEEAGKYSD